MFCRFVLLLLPCLVAASGALIGISPAESVPGKRALSVVEIAIPTGIPTKLVSLNKLLGYNSDGTATADQKRGIYYVSVASSTASSVVYKIGIESATILGQQAYNTSIGMMSFSSKEDKLYAVAACTAGSATDCLVRIDADTLQMTPFAPLPDNWVAFEDGLALDEETGILYCLAANMVNETIDHSLTFGIDTASGKIVSQAKHQYGPTAPEIVFSVFFDSVARRMIGLCSG